MVSVGTPHGPIPPRSPGGRYRARVVASTSGAVRRLLEAEQVRYLLVAGTTTLCYLGMLALLLQTPLHYVIAILIAQAVIIVSAFPAYRSIVFRSQGRVAADFVRFLGVWSSGMIAGLIATPALVELAGWPPLLAQVVAIVVIAVATYLAHRFISFRHRPPPQKDH